MKKIILIFICALSITVFFIYISSKTANLTHGFSCYYAFSRIMLEGEDVNKGYDTNYLNSKIIEYGITGVRDIQYNPPASAILFSPVAAFDPPAAKITWTALNVLLYLLSILLLLKIFDIKFKESSSLILITISFLFIPVYHGFNLGQAYVFLLFMFTLSLYGLKKENAFLISLPLAVILVIKGYGIFPLISLAVLGKWKAAILTILFSIAIILITLPLIGTEAWRVYLSYILPNTVDNKFAANTAYQTFNSLIQNIFGSLPGYITLVIFILSAIAAGITVFRKNTMDNYSALLIFSAAAGLNIILAPIAEDYHYALLLPLIYGTGKIVIDNFKEMKVEALIFALSLLLIVLPFKYKSLNDASFPLILLGYPVLYGGILMLILLIRILSKTGLKPQSGYTYSSLS